ncbi:hypothetical protein DPSP01_009499 [Paraphaeosphaeria sporulosa]
MSRQHALRHATPFGTREDACEEEDIEQTKMKTSMMKLTAREACVYHLYKHIVFREVPFTGKFSSQSSFDLRIAKSCEQDNFRNSGKRKIRRPQWLQSHSPGLWPHVAHVSQFKPRAQARLA